MLIGIDASRAAATRRTGTENYSLHLILGLLALGAEHRFRLYFNQAPPPGLFPDQAEQRIMPFPRLWTHLRLSREMISDPPDLLFVPSHVMPLVHPRRCVVTVHDLGYHYHPEAHTLSQNAYLRWSTRRNARVASRVLADSKATANDLQRFYQTPQDKIAVVYPGFDRSLVPATEPELVASVCSHHGISGPYLLYVGTLQPRKNLARLVQAFHMILAEVDISLQLVLAGQKGWLYEDILAQVRRLGLTDRVIMPGYVPDSDLAALLSGALAFVYPSLYEGFGLPVLEAMACGTPVVCSDVSSLPEVAGDAALLVDPLDSQALSAALVQLVHDVDLRHELIKRGVRQAKRFSWRRCAEQTLEALDEVGSGFD